jgi:hypothetical protein
VRKVLLAVALVAGAVTVAPAHAAPPEITGNPCGYVAAPSPDAPDEWTGVLYSTPEKLSHVAGSPTVSGRLTCSLKVGTLYDDPTHNDPAVASTQGDVTPAVAVAPPVPVSFHAGTGDVVVVCAQVDVVGEGTYYLTEYGGWHFWTTDPGNECKGFEAIAVIPPYVTRIAQLVGTAIDAVNGVFVVVDPVVCALLASLAPGAGPVVIDPTGDTYLDGELWYDCQPYA